MSEHQDDQRHPVLHAVPPPDDGERPPPASVDAERAVLGAILAHPGVFHVVQEHLEPSDFYWPKHELIYDAAAAQYAAGLPITLLTVHERLAATKSLGRAGGGPYLHELATSSPMGQGSAEINAVAHAQIVATKARLRTLVTVGTRVRELGYAGNQDPGDAIAVAMTALSAATPANYLTTTSTWTPVDLDAVLAGEIDEQPPTVCPRNDGAFLLYPAAVHSISGEPESGKTWVAIYAACDELARGHDVLFIDFEDRVTRVIARMLAAGASPAQLRAHFRYIRPDAALSSATMPHLVAAAAGTSYVVIDGITEAMTLHGLSLLDNEDVARWLTLLPRRLADTGAAVLQIDHVIKNSENRGRYAIGGQHKLAGIDGCAYKITVTEPFGRGKRGHARITLDKDREGHVRAIALGHTVATLTLDARENDRYTPDQLRIFLDVPQADLGPDGSFRPTGYMVRVAEFIERSPGTTKNGIEQGIKGKTSHVREALQALINEGYVRTEDGPRRAVFHHLERPFQEGDL